MASKRDVHGEAQLLWDFGTSGGPTLAQAGLHTFTSYTEVSHVPCCGMLWYALILWHDIVSWCCVILWHSQSFDSRTPFQRVVDSKAWQRPRTPRSPPHISRPRMQSRKPFGRRAATSSAAISTYESVVRIKVFDHDPFWLNLIHFIYKSSIHPNINSANCFSNSFFLSSNDWRLLLNLWGLPSVGPEPSSRFATAQRWRIRRVPWWNWK